MKDYKQKTEDLIEDCNLTISDLIFFPQYCGGKFELIMLDGTTLEEGVVTDFIEGHLRFVEGDKQHTVVRFTGRISLDFYRNFYWRIFRSLFLTIDCVIPEDEVNGIAEMSFLNFKTLATEGLKSLNSNK